MPAEDGGTSARAPQRRQDDWAPPSWAPARNPGGAPRQQQAPTRQGKRRSAPRTGQLSLRDAALASIPPASIGLGGLLFARIAPNISVFGLPLPMLVLIVIAAVGYSLTRTDLRRFANGLWFGLLGALTAALPLLALTTSLIREPFVAISRDSAGPSIIAALTTAAALTALAVGCAVKSWLVPERAPFLFLPIALVIPVTLGIRSEIGIEEGLTAIGIAASVSAVTMFLGLMLPRQVQPFVALAAMTITVVLLWIGDRGPVFPAHSGAITGVIWLGLFILGIVLLLLVPILSLSMRHSFGPTDND